MTLTRFSRICLLSSFLVYTNAGCVDDGRESTIVVKDDVPGMTAIDPEGNCADDSGQCIWPNNFSNANSDAWISQNHDRITEMRPKVLVINFANGFSDNGSDVVLENRPWSGSPLANDGVHPLTEFVRKRAEDFVHQLEEGSRYHFEPDIRAEVRPFLKPQVAKVVDLHDDNGHANSDAFPRGQLDPMNGTRTVGYYDLFSEEFASKLGFKESGRYLSLGEIMDRGLVHEIVIVANQVDLKYCSDRFPQISYSNPTIEQRECLDQVTSNILEVAFTAQAYHIVEGAINPRLERTEGMFVKNGGTNFPRQMADMSDATYYDHNTMQWKGRSTRIYFLNIAMGVGCLMHSLAHEFEFRYNESFVCDPGQGCTGEDANAGQNPGPSPNPYLQPLFRRFAGFDMHEKFGTIFTSLYGGLNNYRYSDCDDLIGCRTLSYDYSMFPIGTPQERTIANYVQGCGNAHFAPGSKEAFDYHPSYAVPSFCKTFQMSSNGSDVRDLEQVQSISSASWKHITDNPRINNDCGGDFLVYWFQQMPGFGNKAVDLEGRPMKNWWPFMYY